MITKEQIKVLCKNRCISEPVYATLDRDFKSAFLGYTLSAGTVVEVRLKYLHLDIIEIAINSELIDVNMDPNYLTLLNPPIIPERRVMKASHAFAVVVMFGLLMYLGASWIWAH